MDPEHAPESKIENQGDSQKQLFPARSEFREKAISHPLQTSVSSWDTGGSSWPLVTRPLLPLFSSIAVGERCGAEWRVATT